MRKEIMTGLPIILDDTIPPGEWRVKYHYAIPVEIKCSRKVYYQLKKELLKYE